MAWRTAALVLSMWTATGVCVAQTPKPAPKTNEPSGLSVQEVAGGTVVTDLGYGIQVNKGSSLQRHWFVLNDPTCPIQLLNAGITTAYQSRGDYKYKASGVANVLHGVAAYEVRFLLFDIWENHMHTLSTTKVTDMQGIVPLLDGGEWNAWEGDVIELFTVVSFVAYTRTQDGRIWRYDPNKLLRSVDGIKMKISEQDLRPERDKPKS